MRRREFITLLGGSAIAWPLVARAQQPARLPTIGYLGSGTPATQSQWVAAFVQRLRELGRIEGRTVAIEYRWGEGRAERFAEIAAEFVRIKVDIIVPSGTPTLSPIDYERRHAANPDARQPAAVLAAVKDKPSGRPPSGAVLDRRCARRPHHCAGRDGRMAPPGAEQNNATKQESKMPSDQIP